MNDKSLASLNGKVVNGLDISSDQEVLRFRIAGSQAVLWHTYADCCSETWFADIMNIKQLIGARVTSCSELDMSTYDVDDTRGRQEIDQAYGVVIRTDRGSCSIAYRNSSNGYYGGEAEVYTGPSDFNWTDITDEKEWSA